MMRASLDLTFLFPPRVGETFAPGRSPERVEGSRDKVEIFGTFWDKSESLHGNMMNVTCPSQNGNIDKHRA
jgi:hypothetical protein